MTNNVRIGVGFAPGIVAFTVTGRPIPKALPDDRGHVLLEQEKYSPQEARDLARTILEAAEMAELRGEQVRPFVRSTHEPKPDGQFTVAQSVIMEAIGELRVTRDPDEIARIDAAAVARNGTRGTDAPTRWTFSDGSYVVTLVPTRDWLLRVASG